METEVKEAEAGQQAAEKQLLLEILYDYDGLYYKAIETKENHQRLQTDSEFAASYFESKQAISIPNGNDNESSSNAKSSEEDANLNDAPIINAEFAASHFEFKQAISISNGNDNESSSNAKSSEEDANLYDVPILNEAQFKWDHDAIQLLLNEYTKLKDEFYDPTIKKSVLWEKIRETFLEHGVDISIEFIGTKFRNLKKTFLKIYHNNNEGKVNSTWCYYNTFLDILKDDTVLNKGTFSKLSNPDRTGPSFRKIAPAPSATTLALASAIASNTAFMKNNVVEKTPFYLRKAAKRRATILKKKQKARSKHLEYEEKRVQEIQHLVYVIRENNNIQKERNGLLKQLINKCKCNETVKLFM